MSRVSAAHAFASVRSGAFTPAEVRKMKTPTKDRQGINFSVGVHSNRALVLQLAKVYATGHFDEDSKPLLQKYFNSDFVKQTLQSEPELLSQVLAAIQATPAEPELKSK
eukprot:TRINITY_DN98765_c0_g1_i1.p2 TRINITY_DN98765_c0_g1~~TRINITY_DN98765_c0_g1_i1.p2  ORF type:complete len:109 (-),score=11.36 TRINITY_DN98765_c0_g1_i1:32-358(-)